MSTYRAPMQEIQFVMNDLAGLEQVGKLPGYEDATPDTVTAILEEASKFATEVLDPLNAVGDREGATWLEGGKVKTATGFKDAYRRFAENGWNGLTKNPEHGGQGLPQLVATAVEEMWHGANMAFALCPLLTQGAIEALELCGSDELKATFLPKMVEGVWTGTMNLTEPQAGSDLAAVRTRAVPSDKSGAYKLYGQKIFITYGEQDYTDNIIHLVLARTPTAPEGVKGISLFPVPTATILQHPDVRRMLLTMKAQTEATRALAYVTGAAIDNARCHPDADARKRHQAFVELMIPIVKGWGTEIAQEVTYLGVQVHGGMGFIEETGAAQDYRDARITTIYEGTTAIQANDLIGRKTARDGGVVARSVIGEIVGLATALSADANGALVPIGNELQSAAAALKSAVDWVVPAYGKASRAAHAASVPYLRLWGLVAGGWQLARGAQVAARLLAENKGDASFYRGKVATARFYAECLLPQAAALARAITLGSESVLALSDEQF